MFPSIISRLFKKAVKYKQSLVPSQSTSHTHRSLGSAEAAGQAGSLTNNLLPFQNSVRIAEQH